ncbi:MAG: uridine phosphorylase [Saprospiraceae bacterium]|jgi:uridine phosphorylase
MNRIPESELIINKDGSIYHLNLKPGQIARDIITVGDPDRVERVAKHFDSIEFEVSKREFKTVTGSYKGKRLTVISTGIGTDNIDIVFTELDALVNVEFETRRKKEQHTKLRFYRIGTSGSLISELKINTILISEMAVGLDGLMHYYERTQSTAEDIISEIAKEALSTLPNIYPYASSASKELVEQFSQIGMKGITVTATGFYGPQGRFVIGSPKSSTFIDDLASQKYGQLRFTNLEMETAGIYGMSTLLGHQAISINAIIANREDQTFSKKGGQLVDELIVKVLDIIC